MSRRDLVVLRLALAAAVLWGCTMLSPPPKRMAVVSAEEETLEARCLRRMEDRFAYKGPDNGPLSLEQRCGYLPTPTPQPTLTRTPTPTPTQS